MQAILPLVLYFQTLLWHPIALGVKSKLTKMTCKASQDLCFYMHWCEARRHSAHRLPASRVSFYTLLSPKSLGS